MVAIRVALIHAASAAGIVFAMYAASPAQEDAVAVTVALRQDDFIIFFGDSLTELAGKEQPKQHVTKGYVRIVREQLGKTHRDKNAKVGWVATGGHTVPDLLKRVDKDVIAKKPTIVVIQIGCNDARRIAKDQFKTSLEELIDRLRVVVKLVDQRLAEVILERSVGPPRTR